MMRPVAGIAAALPLAEAGLPARVQAILCEVHALAVAQLGPALEATLDALERQLFEQAEGARNSQDQAERLDQLQRLRQHRAAFAPRFFASLESSLAALRSTAELAPDAADETATGQPLTLVEDTELDRAIVLREIARRHGQRGCTELLLLGQRFGVLAGRPALDGEQLPLGPHALTHCLRAAGDVLQLQLESQLQLYRQAERQVMERHGQFAQRVNALLDRAGVLPGLVYAPYRTPRGSSPQRRTRPPAASSHCRPMTGWHGQGRTSGWSQALAGLAPAAVADDPPRIPPAMPGAAQRDASARNAAEAAATAGTAPGAPGVDPQAAFATLQQLVAAQRTAGGLPAVTPAAAPVVLPPQAATGILGRLQSLPLDRARGQRRRTVEDVREAALARLRNEHGPGATLPPEQEDAFDLLAMLYREIGREVRSDAPAHDMLERLQVPVVRAALQDQAFFVGERHPARELLNAVAESGAAWLGEDEGDAQLVQRLEQVVDRVVEAYDGDPTVFELANQDVQEHHRAQVRKAEVAERRQVEAARGRDRLATAKRQASDAIGACLGGRTPPQFVQALMNQAWADVLTLTALRHGEDSPEWRERGEATARIVQVTCNQDAAPDPALGTQIDAALRQVGYHEDEAGAIARRLSRSEDDEVTSRTELTAKLKARARLGDDGQARRNAPPPRSSAAQACYEQARTLPFGTWFEFVLNQQGDLRRQRLSWYSTVTGNALFVNARGQKAAEQSLDGLARLMAAGQARVVTEDRSRLVDRAWHATVRALRGLAGRAEPVAQGAGA